MFGMAFENLSAYLDSLREKGVPGCDLIVKQDHREIYRHTAGFRDAEGVQPVRMDDMYWLFSCTKVLTTCAESFRSDWGKDFHEPGLTEEAGIPVRRFRTRKPNMHLHEPVNKKLMKGFRVTREEEETFVPGRR